MQKKDRHSFQPFGICHRLFNFIVNSLLGSQVPGHGSTEVPFLEDNHSNSHGVGSVGAEAAIISTKYPAHRKSKSSEIQVEFKNTNGLEYWAPIVNGNKDQPQVQKSNDNEHKKMEKGNKEVPRVKEIGVSNGISHSKIQEKIHSQDQVEPMRGLKKIVTIKLDGAAEEDKGRNGKIKTEKNMTTERFRAGMEVDNVKMKAPPASNINEKLDVFIRSRKEAMRRNYNSEPKAF